MDRRKPALPALALTIGAGPAAAKICVRQDGKGVVHEVDGIAADLSGCHPFAGKVVGCKFAASETTLDTVTYEERDSTRGVNVDLPLSSLGMADVGFITTALQRLPKVTRVIHSCAFACGASGRVSFLDEIR